MVQEISSLTYGQSYRRFSESEQGKVKKTLTFQNVISLQLINI